MSAPSVGLGPALKVFDWTQGYDGEWEFTITVHEHAIVWHLELDPQWSDPPETVVQSIDDYLRDGPPATFAGGRYDAEIRAFVTELRQRPRS